MGAQKPSFAITGAGIQMMPNDAWTVPLAPPIAHAAAD